MSRRQNQIAAPFALAACALALAALLAPAAQAAPVTIAGWGEGAGQVNSPLGVAVDPSNGDLYVADGNNFRIDRFDSSGEFLLAWGWGVADGKSQELQVCGPAADPPTTRCFYGEGANLARGPGAIAPRAIALSREGGESYLYVADRGNHRLSKFDSEGAFLYAAGGDTIANGAAGAGTLSPGSSVITAVQTTAKAFVVGQPIEGAGIEAGTTILATGAETITLSKPAGPGAGGPGTAISSPEGAGNVPSNERQTVALDANTTGGSFALTFSTRYPSRSSATAEAIPAAASAAEVQEKLAALANIGAGNVAVTGPAGGPWTVEFQGPRYADTDVAQLGADAAGLTVSSGAKQVTVSSTKGAEVCTVPAACKAGSPGTGPGELNAPLALALDPEGKLWVGDEGRLQRLDTDGSFLEEITLPDPVDVEGLAIDSAGDFYVIPETGDFYVIPETPPGVRKLEAGTGALLATIDAAGVPESLALDAEDNLYVGGCERVESVCTTPYRFKTFDPAGEQVSQFGAGQVIGRPGFGNGVPANALAVDEATQTLYVASSGSSVEKSAVQAFPVPEPGPLPEAQHVTDLLPDTATLAARLNPEGNATTYHFEYLSEAAYQEQGESFEGAATQSTETKALPSAGFDEEAVKEPLTGLIPDTAYRFRLVATNHCDPEEAAKECTVAGPPSAFATPTVVGIQAQWATEVTARAARLHAELDPFGGEGETWWIEYGTSAAYGSRTPEGSLPASLGAVPRSAQIVGLLPATGYHYRFAARGERDGVQYTVHGPDRVLTTQLTGLGFALPDERAWEMVSPPKKYGGLVSSFESAQGGHVQAAAAGGALAYLSIGPLQADPEGSRSFEASSVLARRGAGGSWSSRDLTPPHTEVTPFPAGKGLEYQLFDPELQSALLEPRDGTPLSPRASERTPYLRANTDPPAYEPLLSGKPGFANVPAGTVFGGDPALAEGAVTVEGAGPDLAHVALKSQPPLAEGLPGKLIYLWEAGRLEAVSLRPAGEGGAAVNGELGSGAVSVKNAISADGARVFWTEVFSGEGLYLRDTERGQTLRLDAVQPGAPGFGTAEPLFQGAGPDGAVAYFTDSRALSEDSSPAGRDLYRCEVVLEAGELGCELSVLSAPTASPLQSAEVQGMVAGMGEDGSRLYFVARGVLDPEPVEHGAGPEEAVAGQPNLYTWQEGEGTRFVAGLGEGDYHDWGLSAPGGPAFALNRSAAASPSGRYLAFMSERPLTGYDNRDAKSGEPAQEVFRYDAATGELICASCNPSGARPRALRPVKIGETGDLPLEFDPQQLWSGRPVAAALPEATKTSVGGASLYRPRAVHDNGRLFFNAADSLVGADSNGAGDVYQYEPTGLGSCSASSGGAAVVRHEGGCLALVSSGAAEGSESFLDASVGGGDVFFYSPAQLSVTDLDRELDIYDARIGGLPATLEPIAECQGEACQAPAGAPEDPTPASAAFRGAGNVRPPARSCRSLARRTARLSRRAKRARARARRAKSPRAAKRMRRSAKRNAHRARASARRARSCRARAARRAGR